MKKFFNVKRIVFLLILCISFITLILMLIYPIGVYPHSPVTVYSYDYHRIMKIPSSSHRIETTSPFTVPPIFYSDENGKLIPDSILLVQTIVFTIVGIIFVVFLVLFLIELKRAGAFTRRPTKVARLEARLADLEKQIDELKKEE